MRHSSQDEEQKGAPGVAAYLLASGEVPVAVDALISQGALGECTEGLPNSCAFEGLVIKGMGWPCASVSCTHHQSVGSVASRAVPMCSRHGLPAVTEDAV